MRAIVCFSGGLDSTVLLMSALQRYGRHKTIAIFFNYGQRNIRERFAARVIVRQLGVPLEEIEVPLLFAWHSSGLLEKNPPNNRFEIRYRNGVFFFAAIVYAADKFPNDKVNIYTGINGGYPDCTVKYVATLGKAITDSTDGTMHLIAPFQNMNKAEILEYGLKINAPIFSSWSCLENGESECGKCPACRDKAIAMAINGLREGL